MHVQYKNISIDCTPDEYVRLVQLGIFDDDRPVQDGLKPYRDWIRPSPTDTVMAYGCMMADPNTPTCTYVSNSTLESTNPELFNGFVNGTSAQDNS